jgi:Protein of unknown function (DUF3223)
MARARQIKIETRHFEKAGDATSFFREMLNRYRSGDRVNDAHALDLHALLQRHDELVEKTGVGIDYFCVSAAPEPHSGKCFWIVRTDGSKVDISYVHCLEKKPYD